MRTSLSTGMPYYKTDLTMECRASQRIPGDRAPFAHRNPAHPQAVPHENFRTQHCRGQVKILVLPRQDAQGQEGQR